MEGFRVLPYGEQGNDWLQLDTDYRSRIKKLPYLKEFPEPEQLKGKEESLSTLGSDNYFGAVFLTIDDSPGLRMLVNREGFVPEASYDELVRIVRTGIDLCTRVRAQTNAVRNQERSDERRNRAVAQATNEIKDQIARSIQKAQKLAGEARLSATQGDFSAAEQYMTQVVSELSTVSQTSDRISETDFVPQTENSVLRVLASVGTQMTAFIHEINGLLGTANAVEAAFTRLIDETSFDVTTKQRLSEIRRILGDLRRSIERQASYLTDVVSPDARRRRSRLSFRERFDTASRLVENAARRRNIIMINDIPKELKSPPMFPAEITVIFSNLLTNAIKAAGDNGKILSSGIISQEGATQLR
ncbi:MAG: hypothetical protein EOO88_55940, partial [Pedobacter sp.]